MKGVTLLLWRFLWRVNPALLAIMVACSGAPQHIRMEGRQSKAVIHIPRTADVQPVLLEQEEFQQVMRQLAREVRLNGSPRATAERMFQLDPLSGNYLYLMRERKLVPTGVGESLEGTLTEEDLATAERYRLWCQRVHHLYGDCLGGALVAGRYLDAHGRYVWALALSKSPVLDELRLALGEMVEVRSLISTALWTLASMLLVMALNPVAPALVAVLGVGMILYLGYDTLYNLVTGWFRLMEEVNVATTFEQIREAGERFGKILARQAARAFALLLMAAIGRTAHEFAAKVPTLPGSAHVAMQAEHQAGFSLSALGTVEEIAISTIVFQELNRATLTCRSVLECRAALTGQLRKLAKAISTPGTELNQLVTRQQPR
ncbi:MAG TPA: hypothetical protein VF815_00505 [Myxococcaceae bacterium]|jgi:hypothetical protein